MSGKEQRINNIEDRYALGHIDVFTYHAQLAEAEKHNDHATVQEIIRRR